MTHYATCPEHDRLIEKESEAAAESIVASHNESMHDGEEVAEVVEDTADAFNDLVDRVREEYRYDQYEDYIATLARRTPWKEGDDE